MSSAPTTQSRSRSDRLRATPDLELTSAYDYELPEPLVATTPSATRSDSRLLVLPGDRPAQHRRFTDLDRLLRAGDLLVRNCARVVSARLEGSKVTGGRFELLALHPLDADWSTPGPVRFLALGRSSRPIRKGTELRLDDGERIEVVGRGDEGRLELQTESPLSLDAWLTQHGTIPLPPYIRRARSCRAEAVPSALDERRYQTVYAAEPGAVAAPTAGLHFTEALLDKLQEAGVELADLRLDVGIGTFRPIQATRLTDHQLHSERYQLPSEAAERINRARADGRRVISVGTTVFRALEDQAERAPEARPGTFETHLFVRPGRPIRWVDGLITNFHLPRSSLLVLVSAFAGYTRVRRAYAQAIAHEYRFYSYGDAMLVFPEEPS